MKLSYKKFGGFIFLLYICSTKDKKTFIMMDYTKLKKGEVITMIDEYDTTRIIIVNNVIDNHRLYTYVELVNIGAVFFEKYEPGVYHDLNNCVCREAEDEEKDKLYNAIGKHFTEEYDKDWYNHFTDSSYFDIQDYLLDVFCIKVEEYDDDLIYPDFVDDIHTYIWNKLCDAMGCKAYDGDEFVEQLVNKQEFIEKAKKWLEKTLYIHTEIEEDKHWCTTTSINWVTTDDYESVEDFINGFCKAMEE